MARNQNYGSGNIKKKKKKKGIINSDKFDIYYGYSQHKLICFFFFCLCPLHSAHQNLRSRL